MGWLHPPTVPGWLAHLPVHTALHAGSGRVPPRPEGSSAGPGSAALPQVAAAARQCPSPDHWLHSLPCQQADGGAHTPGGTPSWLLRYRCCCCCCCCLVFGWSCPEQPCLGFRKAPPSLAPACRPGPSRGSAVWRHQLVPTPAPPEAAAACAHACICACALCPVPCALCHLASRPPP